MAATEKQGLLAHGEQTTPRNRQWRGGNWRWRLAILLSLAMVGMLGCWEAGIEGHMTILQYSPPASSVFLPFTTTPKDKKSHHHHHHQDFDPYKHLGHLSPFFEPPNTPTSLKSGTPPSCTATSRAFLIHRHGSRNPHADELAVIQGLADYIKNNSALFSNPQADVPFAWSFLARGSWNNTLGTDDLTAPGRQQLFDHGVALRLRYPDLYVEPDDESDDADSDAGDALAVAGDEDRVVESAEWFLAGYYGRAAAGNGTGNGNGSGNRKTSSPPALKVIPEDAHTPSWITPHSTCSAWDEQYGGNLTERWGAVYLPPIAARINDLLGRAWPGVRFSPAHVHAMFWACAYGTAARGVGSSPWCGVFEPEELLRNEYEYDLRQRGFSGYGLPGDMGAVLGGLLVGNVTAFLRGEDEEKKFSLNFGHDKTLAFGLTALGLAADGDGDGDDAFPPEGPVDPHRSWQSARLVPFASYMLWKRLECGGAEGSSGSRIQLILNGANYGLGPTGCAIDEYGTCGFDDFLGTDKVKAALNVTHGGERWKEVCEH